MAITRCVADLLLPDANQLADNLELERAYRMAKQAVVDHLLRSNWGRRISYYKAWHEARGLVKLLSSRLN
jgi:hypothetical protein